MDLLARREYGAAELSVKLLRRFPSHQDEIEQEIYRLTAEGLQSDLRLAESFLRVRSGRGQGPLKIKAELRARGVSAAVIAEAFAACDLDWVALAKTACCRRFGEQVPTDIRDRAKRSRFLQGRGFSFDQISQVVSA